MQTKQEFATPTLPENVWDVLKRQCICNGEAYSPNPSMLKITNRTAIPLAEIELTAVRSQGAGGQNVNKVATAIHLRFDINNSSLSPLYKERLLNLNDSRITKDGTIIIKSQQHRTQDQNKQAALQRLQTLVQSVTITPKKRKPTKPSRSANRKRLDRKAKHSQRKAQRGNIRDT